jgi:TetR/AcrR family transcriptional regulator
MAKKTKLLAPRPDHEPAHLLSTISEKERSILLAAVDLIGEHGIDGATTAAIAKRANVTEKTLFRYFPSKKDLIRRVLFPLIVHTGLTQQWGILEQVLRSHSPTLKKLCAAAMTEELAVVRRNEAIVRVATIELLRNEEMREAMGKLWFKMIWQPLLENFQELMAKGEIRKDVDLEVLGRALHCLHVGYFVTSSVFAPGRRWNDAAQIEAMADLLARGAAR